MPKISLLLILLNVACGFSTQGSIADPQAETTLALPLVRKGTAAPIWQPAPGLSWQWQLSFAEQTGVDLSIPANVYDIDLFDNPAQLVAELHEQGRATICYLNAGSWEDWRPDRDQFPAETLGKAYEGWLGERWLDIRRIDLLAPVLTARLDLCRQKGFDAVEPDNIDGYTNDTGFPLTDADQLAFNRWLAQEAHARGLAIGLKNDPDQAGDLLADFDFAVTEDCFHQGWCEEMLPFIQAGKAVFAAEYTDTGIHLQDFCPQARTLGFSAILKNRELDAYRAACPEAR